MSDQKQTRLTPRGHRHAEAFCLMWYQCKQATCRHLERIWNSRDGVTPFGMQCPSCGESTMMHVAFGADLYAPGHKLRFGQKFWRDGTPDEAEAFMRQRIERYKGTEYERSTEEDAELIRRVRAGEISEFQQGWPMLDCHLGDRS